MSHPVCAYLYVMERQEPQGKSEPLQINGLPISFFQEPILQQAVFNKHDIPNDQDGFWQNPALWSASFFVGTPLERMVLIFLFEPTERQWQDIQESNSILGKEAQKHIRSLVKNATAFSLNGFPSLRACWFESADPNETLSPFLPRISLFLRGSKTLTTDSLASLDGHDALFDSSGFAVVSEQNRIKNNPDAQLVHFLRMLIASALMQAYFHVIETACRQIAADLMQPGKKSSSLIDLYEQVTCFNAAQYFSRPIKRGSTLIKRFWDALAGHEDLQGYHQEMVVQLREVSQLLAAREREANERFRAEEREARENLEKIEQASNDRINRKLTILGLVITVLLGWEPVVQAMQWLSHLLG